METPPFYYKFTPYFVKDETSKIVGVTYRPIINIAIIHKKIQIPCLGLIDSGADECSFPGAIGRYLGHNIEKGTPREFLGIGGKTTAYLHQNYLLVQNIQVRCNIYFSNEWDDWPFGLLGRHGFFTHFKILFDYSKKIFEITPKKFAIIPKKICKNKD